MSKSFYSKFKHAALAFLAAISIAATNPAMAEAEWVSFTMDNDTFVGNDNGYTNGMFFAWWDGPGGEEKAKAGFLARAMLWSLPDGDSTATDVDIGTIGQLMITPDDIEQDPAILPPDDLPYGGLLFYTDTFVRVSQNYADSIAVTLGVVGEYSFAEESQEFVHDVISSEEPCCWDEQLDDEVVFQVSRGRVWKTWEADSGNKWTVPIGGGAGRVFKIGKQPVNVQAQAFYNVEKPEFGADWQLRLQLQFLFPK